MQMGLIEVSQLILLVEMKYMESNGCMHWQSLATTGKWQSLVLQLGIIVTPVCAVPFPP